MPGFDYGQAGRRYATEVFELSKVASTTEETYYPAVRDLLTDLLQVRGLPYKVRVATSEERQCKGTDRPDVAIYGGAGTFLVVAGEVKGLGVGLEDLALSIDRKDQIGRYLAQTGVILLSNLRSFGLLALKPGLRRNPGKPVPPGDRQLLATVKLWDTAQAFDIGGAVQLVRVRELADLLEQAVTEFAPIAEPIALAKVLAVQARKAKGDLPAKFEAVQGLLEDYGVALGLTFEGEEGAEFFRSSLIQTAFYALFAAWTLWHTENDGTRFEWQRVDRYLKIPFLGKLFYEFRHPDRIEELHLAPHLDRATDTLARVDRQEFFSRFRTPSLREELTQPDVVGAGLAAAAITYFYEPFLEAFDPSLRKELGVWYTPPEIVRYQVRNAERILREDLNCKRGFADPQVVVLDPCCGTGAYLIEVVRRIARQLKSEGEDNLLGAKVLDAVCRRVVGFEILTAPFVIAQLQLYLILTDLGATPEPKDRPAVFLTNALTGWDGPEQIKLNFPELKQEHEAARSIKRQAKIIVVLGNPPYNRFAGTALKEESDLVDHYKGIKRNEKGKQVGKSLLYLRFGVRKQLLDDLYIRFLRLGERRIGEQGEFGIVSYISNSSYLTGRSHPLMRESLLKNFDTIWIDNLHGNRIASERTPWGDSCETIFAGNEAAGIKVGTAISTFVKQRKKGNGDPLAKIFHRDFWGRSEEKRGALLESLSMDEWSEKQHLQMSERPGGPRAYEKVAPVEESRFRFSPRDLRGGFEDWPGLDELFPVSFQGINPNRGIEGSVIDVNRDALEKRMRTYFDARSFDQVRSACPGLCKPRARYVPEGTWRKLCASHPFDRKKTLPYLLFPFDLRWIYYETEAKFLNEARSTFGDNLRDNEFLVTVPQPRRAVESRPLISTTLVDLHVHDRGSVCFPRHVSNVNTPPGGLFATPGKERHANLAPKAWGILKTAYGLSGDLSGRAATKLVEELFRFALAVVHSPSYERDHADGLAGDFPHLPIPKSREVLGEVAEIGTDLALLLDPTADAHSSIRRRLGESARSVAVPTKAGGGQIREGDLKVNVSYYGAAQGRWRPRDYSSAERELPFSLEGTGDLFINDTIFFANIPAPLWRYELGGYPVLKKWLGYRHVSRREGMSLTLEEAGHFREMAQRLAALLMLQKDLDRAYEQTVKDVFNAEDLSIR